MNHIYFHRSRRHWHQTPEQDNSRFHLTGHAYLNQRAVAPANLATALSTATDTQTLSALLQSMNGFYAWVEQTPEGLRAAVDHIRSIPLFYAIKEGDFFISDDAEWMRQQIGPQDIDPIARSEYLLAGYVTGPDTLFTDLKQLQAGESLIVRKTETGAVVDTHRYYRFLHQEPAEINEPDLRAELDCVTVGVMQRLIEHAKGRQIVIPLSGGYDSRLIATMLKRLGYDNVLTFTYGVPGNKESEYSKRVADALSLRWHFVEYSPVLWREAWQTSERWEYQKWASGWSSLAHMQDWLAVKKLTEAEVIEGDAIFVPGHTGDFVAGGHIPSKAFEHQSFELQEIDEAILRNHYALTPMKRLSMSPKQWRTRIRDRTERAECRTPWEFADGFEKWEWQERQAKYIGNSVRVYEFFGYDWWMPLWDFEFAAFWQTVPLKFRKNRFWYIEYVKKLFAALSNQSHDQLANASDRKINMLLSFVRTFLRGRLRPYAYRFKPYLHKFELLGFVRLNKESHFLLSGYDDSIVELLESKNFSVIGAHAFLFLSDIETELGRL